MGSPYTIRLPNLTNVMNLNVQNSYKDSTGIYDLELMLLPEWEGVNSNKYFLDKISQKIYVEQKNFGNEATLRFDFSGLLDEEITLQNLKIYSMEDGVRSYITDDYFGDMDNLMEWNTSGCQLSIAKEEFGEEIPETSMVYKKGELISYGINYYDYENDPSKKQYWRYTHEALNDGLNPISGQILDKAIDRFYIDGKYFVEHWQEDSTGLIEYDKLSNVETLTIYIEDGGEAPLVNWIKTLPSMVKEGMSYRLQISVSDKENDILELKTEVYDGKSKLIYTHVAAGISPIPNSIVNGVAKYAAIETGFVTNGLKDENGNKMTPAIAGKYTAICTLRDFLKAGIKSYTYLVLPDAKISAAVSHTPKWEENRLSYNMTKYNSFENAEEAALGLAPRGTHVFWPGEKIILAAQTTGQVASLTAQILEAPEYATTLNASASAADSQPQNWQGELWDLSMLTKWRGSTPIPLTVRFTASFAPETGGAPVVKTQDVSIIIYKPEWYWELHREW
jgi:hypothetical protein